MIASPDLPLRVAPRPRQDLWLSGKHREASVSVLEEGYWWETQWLTALSTPVGLRSKGTRPRVSKPRVDRTSWAGCQPGCLPEIFSQPPIPLGQRFGAFW